MDRRAARPFGLSSALPPSVSARPGSGRRSSEGQATADAVIDSVGVAREAYERFQDAWCEVGRLMRELAEWQWHRVDAYPGWDGTRDVGGGVDMVGWMTEVEERAHEIRSDARAMDRRRRDRRPTPWRQTSVTGRFTTTSWVIP